MRNLILTILLLASIHIPKACLSYELTHSYLDKTYCVKVNSCFLQYINKKNQPSKLLKRLIKEPDYGIVSPIWYLWDYSTSRTKIKALNDKVILCSSLENFGEVLQEIIYYQYNWPPGEKASRYEHFKKHMLQISKNNRREIELFFKCMDSVLTEGYQRLILKCSLDKLKEYKRIGKDPLTFSPQELIDNCDYKSLLKKLHQTFLFKNEIEKVYFDYKTYYINNLLAKKIDKLTKHLEELYTDFLILNHSENFNTYTSEDIESGKWREKLQQDTEKLTKLINQEEKKLEKILMNYELSKKRISTPTNTKLSASIAAFEKENKKLSSIIKTKKERLEKLYSQHRKKKFKTYLFFFVIVIGLIFIWNKYFRLRCPKCGSTELELIGEHIISERWKHSRKDGGPDRRYKDNKLIQTVKKEYKCNKCNYVFSLIEEREK